MPTLRRTIFNPEGELVADGIDQQEQQNADRTMRGNLAQMEAAQRNAELMARLQESSADRSSRERMFGTQEAGVNRRFELGEAGNTRRFELGEAGTNERFRLGESGATERARLGIAPAMGALDLQREQYGEGKPLRTAEQEAKIRQLERRANLENMFFGDLSGQSGQGGGNFLGNLSQGQQARLAGGLLGVELGSDPEAEDRHLIEQTVRAQLMEAAQSPDARVRAKAQSQLKARGLEVPDLMAGTTDLNQMANVRSAVKPDMDAIIGVISSNRWRINPQERQQVAGMIQTLFQKLEASGQPASVVESIRNELRTAAEGAIGGTGTFFEASGSDALRTQLSSLL